MLIDARTLPENEIIETEVCIVGAGAAGISLAREFSGQPFRVCLLESGGLVFDGDTQSLNEGESIGRPYFPLVVSRLRYFGGTTNHWTGWCRPLDEIDFEARDWIPYSGWPFGKSHLDPFYERAQVICQLGPYTYDAEDWETETYPRFPFTGTRVLTKIFQISPPTRFGKAYRDEIAHADNIRTFLYANVVDIETTDNARTVTRLRVACLQGPKFWIAAKRFILATGAIQNARLLLLSNQVQRTGLGNQHDLVGRFFMEHPHVESGVLLQAGSSMPPTLYLDPSMRPATAEKRPIVGALTLSAETLRREKLANFSAILELTPPEKISKGFSSLRVLVRALRRKEIPENFVQHLGKVITDIDSVALALYRKKFSSHIPRDQLLTLYNRTEQVPNPASRVTLTEERDRLGKNRVALNWQLSEIDKYSIKRAHEIIGEEFGRAGLGRLRITFDKDVPLLNGGWHHMGMTRMHVDPKQGVVDANCRVHGISNLFIAGSSVFPTAGYANPTLTIVALAVRLADHMKRIKAS